MTEQEINRVIHEKARGLCWHEEDCRESERWTDEYEVFCKKCNKICPEDNPSYTSDWSAYGPMLEWAKEEKWWIDFLGYFWMKNTENAVTSLLNPLKGSTALAEFITAHPEIFKGDVK